MPKPVTSITLVHKQEVAFFISLFAEVGSDLYPLLREAGIPNDLYQADYEYLPEQTLKQLINILSKQESQQEFAIKVWKACKESYIPKFLQQLQTTNNIKAALQTFCTTLTKVNSGAKVYIDYAAGQHWLVREKQYSEQLWFEYAEIFSIIFLNELMLALVGAQWRPQAVGCQSASSQVFKKLPGLNGAQFYNQRPVTAILLPEQYLDLPVNRYIRGNKQGSYLADLKTLPKSFLASFKVAIQPYLSMGKLPIEWAAIIFDMNVRTLQRKLAAEGVVYSKLVEEMLLEQILLLLKGSNLSITEIAAKMGYSDSAHFTRAFKRQMQQTPRQYRKQHSNL